MKEKILQPTSNVFKLKPSSTKGQWEIFLGGDNVTGDELIIEYPSFKKSSKELETTILTFNLTDDWYFSGNGLNISDKADNCGYQIELAVQNNNKQLVITITTTISSKVVKASLNYFDFKFKTTNKKDKKIYISHDPRIAVRHPEG